MIWQETPFTFLLLFASFSSILLGLYIWFRYTLPGGKIGSLVILTSTEWMLMYALELASADLPTKIFWNKLQYIGICTVPTMWFAFAVYYTGRERWLNRRSLAFLSIMPSITVILAFTNEYHGLIWSDNILNTDASFTVLVNVHGQWFWITAGYLYALMLLGSMLLLIQAFIHPNTLYRRQVIALLVAASAPWLANVLFILGSNPFYPLDPTTMALIISNPIVALAVVYFRVGDIVPMTREVIVESMKDSIVVLDTENQILDLNPSALRLIGNSTSQFIGKPIEDIWPEWSAQMKIGCGTDVGREAVFMRGDEQHIYDVAISPLLDWSGRTVSRVIVLRDITDRKRAEEKIRASLDEKEVLLREIHHRVKNNIQIISSLLSLQSQHIKDTRYIEMVKESQNRIKSMALIHEKLYQSENLANINFDKYIKTLLQGLVRSYGVNAARISVRTEIEDVSLDIDTAIPCGLIINELVSNALKHAFPGTRKGEIAVLLCSDNEHITLTVTDNGVGIPDDVDIRTTTSLGLHLVTLLAEGQLDGEITVERTKGTAFHITFEKAK
jgi:PAS domain S-box-containing protein